MRIDAGLLSPTNPPTLLPPKTSTSRAQQRTMEPVFMPTNPPTYEPPLPGRTRPLKAQSASSPALRPTSPPIAGPAAEDLTGSGASEHLSPVHARQNANLRRRQLDEGPLHRPILRSLHSPRSDHEPDGRLDARRTSRGRSSGCGWRVRCRRIRPRNWRSARPGRRNGSGRCPRSVGSACPTGRICP